MRTLVGLVLFAFLGIAHAAENVGGFVAGGLSSGKLTEQDDPYTYEVDTDSGGGLNLTGALRFRPGIMVRAGFDSIRADGGTACVLGSGCSSFGNDVDVHETRLGVFYAPPMHKVLGFRVGGGYERVSLEIQGSGKGVSDGGFIEGALLINAGRIVTFDVGAALLSLTDDNDEHVRGGEFAAAAIFHAGPVDIGVSGRGLHFETDVSGSSSTVSDDFSEGRLTVGGQWGYAAR